MSLAKYKKSDLKDMLERLALATDGLKNDMEERLSGYLSEKGVALEDVPELASYFADVVGDKVVNSSPSKRVRKSVAAAGTALLGDGTDDEPGAVGRVSQAVSSAVDDLDVSPSKVARWANETRDKVVASSRSSLQNAPVVSQLPSTFDALRAGLSKVSAVATIAVSAEGILLAKALVPLSTEVKIFGLGAVSLPDILTVLFLDAFWKPVLAWAIFQIVPILLGTLFNLRSAASHSTGGRRSTRSRAASSSSSSTTGGGALELLTYAVDPVAFAAFKLALVHAAFDSSLGKYALGKQIDILAFTVGKDVMQVGALLTLVFAIYEAILS